MTTDITYDSAGKVTSITQHGANGDAPRVRTFDYDAQERIVSATSPEAGKTTYTYDTAGNLATKTDARGMTITYSWDASKRLVAKQYTDNTPAQSFTFSADGLSRSSYAGSQANPQAKREYSFDAQGRLLSLTVHASGSVYTISKGYDTAGRLNSITYPDGRTIAQTWTSAGLLSSIAEGSYQYLSHPAYFAPSGHLKQATLGNGVIIHQTFDSKRHLTSLVLANSDGSSLLDESFTYTNTGSLSAVTDNLHTKDSSSYNYDQLGRVQSAYGATHEQFAYDAFGNLALDSTEAFNARNQITGGAGYTYDQAGEMTFDGAHRYAYDGDGLIVSVDDGTIRYSYDAEGNRLEKQLADGLHEYVWLGGQLLAEKSPDGSSTDYIYAGDVRIAGVLQQPATNDVKPAPQVTYYVTSPLGVTRTSLSMNGSIASSGIFAPFGSQAKGSTAASSISFSDEVHDPETGLDTYQYRSYNPRLGRWMSADPSSEHFARLDNPQTYNLYAYVTNDPLKFSDLQGLCAGDGDDGDDNGDGGYGCGVPTCDSCGGGGGADPGGGDGGGGSPPDSGGSGGPGSCPVDACVVTYPDPPPDTQGDPPDASVNVECDSTCFITAPDPGTNSGSSSPIDTNRRIAQAKKLLNQNCQNRLAGFLNGYSTSAFFAKLYGATFYQYTSVNYPYPPGYATGYIARTFPTNNEINLFPDFYAEDDTTQAFTLIHEGVHLFGNKSDNDIITYFNLGNRPFTDYLKGGCQ